MTSTTEVQSPETADTRHVSGAAAVAESADLESVAESADLESPGALDHTEKMLVCVCMYTYVYIHIYMIYIYI